MSDTETHREFQSGDVIDGQYEVVRRIGRGGMGTVYEARQVDLDRLVALKVLRPEFAQRETAAKRFEREAKAASSVEHRNVVDIVALGRLPSGELYYTMELLRGRDLSQLLGSGGAMPWSRVGWITLQIVRAFCAIHARGIVHRDLKPANCFVLDPRSGDERDTTKILDFGIANLQHDEPEATNLTGTADVIGSVRYMSPEQAASAPVDARTDIYALGIVLYELLTGEVPFPGPGVPQVIYAHRYELPRPPRERIPDILPEVEAIILRALEKDPADRFQSMEEVADALSGLVEVPGSSPERAFIPQLTGAWATSLIPHPHGPRNRWLLSGLVSAVLFVGAFGTTQWLEERENVPVALPGRGVDESLLDEWPVPERQETLFDPPLEYSGPRDDRSRGGDGHDGEGSEHEIALLDRYLGPYPWLGREGRLGGVVRDAGRRGLVEARVCAWTMDPRAPAKMRRTPRCTSTNEAGEFELSAVAPGIYDVHVFKREFLPQSYAQIGGHALVLDPGEIQRLEFSIERGGISITGSIVDTNGMPTVGARIAVSDGPRAMAIADESGEFELWVAHDDVPVTAWAQGYADFTAEALSAEPLSVVLEREVKLYGVVVDEAGERVSHAWVSAGRRPISPWAYANSDGEFEFLGLSSGEYRPMAWTSRTRGVFGRVLRAEGGVRTPEINIEVHPIQAPVEHDGSTDGGDDDPRGIGGTSGDAGDTSGEHGTEGGDGTTGGGTASGDDGADGRKIETDRVLRRRLGRKLKRCGYDGNIEVTAEFVLANGKLLKPMVKVSGVAADESKVEACARGHLDGFKLNRRGGPTTFKPLRVSLPASS